MTYGKARVAEPSLFQGLASSPACEATRRATRNCFNPLEIRLDVEDYSAHSHHRYSSMLTRTHFTYAIFCHRKHDFSKHKHTHNITSHIISLLGVENL